MYSVTTCAVIGYQTCALPFFEAKAVPPAASVEGLLSAIFRINLLSTESESVACTPFAEIAALPAFFSSTATPPTYAVPDGAGRHCASRERAEIITLLSPDDATVAAFVNPTLCAMAVSGVSSNAMAMVAALRRGSDEGEDRVS